MKMLKKKLLQVKTKSMHNESNEGTDFDDAFEEENLNNDAAQGQDNLKQDFEV